MDTTTITGWHTKSIEEVSKQLNTSLNDGLTESEAVQRQQVYGFNELESNQGATWIRILLRQFLDIMNWIFIALGAVSLGLKDYITGPILIVIALVNFYLTFQQEYAAEQTLAALKELSTPTAEVIRDGVPQTIASSDLVPGDILVLKEGDSVAADARLVYLSNLEVDEALLTGESVPVQKELTVLDDENEPLGDRKNMVYSSTFVSKGRGQAIVTSTGMKTEIGKVAEKLNDTDDGDRTQIQKGLHRMYVFLLAVGVVSIIVVFASVKFQLDYGIVMYAISAALSVLPAGLTTVLTLTLVIGGKEMTRHQAIVRKLKVLETLGSLTHIFSDKTGTLTMAKMVVVRFWTPQEGYFYVTPHGLAPQGETYRTFDKLDDNPLTTTGIELVEKKQLHTNEGITRLVECAALCNMSSIRRREHEEKELKVHRSLTKTSTRHSNVVIEIPAQEKDNTESDDWIPSGAPTEVALQVFAHKFDKGKPQLLENDGWELVQEYQFNSTIKKMSTVWYNRPLNYTVVFTKGATEKILSLCQGSESQKWQDEVMSHVDSLAAKGLRVIALAYRKEQGKSYDQSTDRDIIEKDLIFLGLTGIYDPPRPESRQAVKEAHQAGISVHMLTGDHVITATAIAKELNILNDTMPPEVLQELVMTGPQFDALTDEQTDSLAHLPFVVARCSPETKVKMIEASKRRSYIAAMTGDGVNDSPSLRKANVGIAMGKNGSDVAKQASDIILTDDNFATIIRAIAEGRRIYQNIQRFLLYYWISVLSLWFVLMVSLAFRDTDNRSVLPISTIQILFVFVVVTPPAGVLSVLPPSKTIMKEPPRSPKESLFNREIILDLLAYFLCLAFFSIISFIIPMYTRGHHGIEGSNCDSYFDYATCESLFRGRGMFLAYLSLASIIVMLHCRSYREPEFDMEGMKKTLKTKAVFFTFLFDIVCLVIFFYVPDVSQKGFYMLPISWEWAIVVAFLVLTIAYGEIYKLLKRRYLKPSKPHQFSPYILME
ncbi:Calcium-transporting ATPase 3 [Choanephora cucurbitarum]|uniref:Sodium/potassium exporting P-type ATPase 1 n=1 Tax=Choanephora cucurbitarum TaxID=101091 RepID=A0A1C7NNI3_9FUNG|nr:Calcium-transporting ATPase 3 [Choanephora cucurbitarum]